MKSLSVEEQIAAFRASANFARRLHRGFLAGAIACALAAWVLWHPLPALVAVLLGVVGFSERKAGPNVATAIAAYDSGRPGFGELTVEIERWTDGDAYRAIVRERGYPDWTYEFIPQGWQPEAGTCPARIWRADIPPGRPVLAVVEAGISIPRDEPKKKSDMPG